MKLSGAPSIDPVTRIPVAGTLAFLPGGDLLVMERRWESTLDDASGANERGVVVHRFAARTWEKNTERSIRGLRSSPLGCAVSPDGLAVATGYKVVKLIRWPSAEAIASLKGVKYELERESLGFSPSGARLAVGDGGYVGPGNRWVRVYAASDGSESAKLRTDEFSLQQVVMADDETIVVRGLRHDFEYGSRTKPPHVIACYDATTREVRWRRRYWSAEHRFALDLARARLWTSGEQVTQAGDESFAVEQGVECLSLSDGSTLAAVEIAYDVQPRGVLAFTGAHVVAALRQGGDVPVFAIDVTTGARAKLAGANGRYAAYDPETGLVALSLSGTETGLYALPA